MIYQVVFEYRFPLQQNIIGSSSCNEHFKTVPGSVPIRNRGFAFLGKNEVLPEVFEDSFPVFFQYSSDTYSSRKEMTRIIILSIPPEAFFSTLTYPFKHHSNVPRFLSIQSRPTAEYSYFSRTIYAFARAAPLSVPRLVQMWQE